MLCKYLKEIKFTLEFELGVNIGQLYVSFHTALVETQWEADIQGILYNEYSSVKTSNKEVISTLELGVNIGQLYKTIQLW